jgi:putative acetyltransferase
MTETDGSIRDEGTPRRDIAVRPERPDDHAAIGAVVAAAFGSPAEAQLVEDIRASGRCLPDLSLVAESGGEVVGHVMISYVDLDDGGTRRRVASLSPLAVRPDRQRRGIGAALVQAALQRADALGEPLVVLEGNPAYYGRFGFEHSVRHGIEIDLPSWAPPEAAQVRRLSQDDPAIRGRVVYPAAFDRFA